MENLTGNKFGRWTVIKRAENGVRPSGQEYIRWECLCDCGIRKIVDGNELRNGNSKSCGCLARELTIKRESLFNTYDLFKDYGIGYDSNNNYFYFDIEDYDLIKNYYFRINDDGYVMSNSVGMLHRFIMNCDADKVIDHINNTKYDNRKSNLRICSQSQNVSRKIKMKTNTSGIIGVSWSNRAGKWLVRLNKNKKCVYLEYFQDKESAIKARLNAELKYFGDFSPQKHLFKQYGITNYQI
jgi:hypothetical protein